MQIIELEIDGMHCGGCVQRVAGALKKLPDVEVEKVEIGKAFVQVEEGQEPIVMAALERLGFEARIVKGG